MTPKLKTEDLTPFELFQLERYGKIICFESKAQQDEDESRDDSEYEFNHPYENFSNLDNEY